jgi:hypothetical protein
MVGQCSILPIPEYINKHTETDAKQNTFQKKTEPTLLKPTSFVLVYRLELAIVMVRELHYNYRFRYIGNLSISLCLKTEFKAMNE